MLVNYPVQTIIQWVVKSSCLWTIMIYFDSIVGNISKLSKINSNRKGNTKSNQTVQQEVLYKLINSLCYLWIL